MPKAMPASPSPPHADANLPADRTSPLHDLSLRSLATHATPDQNASNSGIDPQHTAADPADALRAKLEAYRQQKQAAKASAVKPTVVPRNNTPGRALHPTPLTKRAGTPAAARAPPTTARIARTATRVHVAKSAIKPPAMPGILSTLAVAARRPAPLAVRVQLQVHGPSAVGVVLELVDTAPVVSQPAAGAPTPVAVATPMQPRPGARRVSLAPATQRAADRAATATTQPPQFDAALLRVQLLQWQYSHTLLQRRASTSIAQVVGRVKTSCQVIITMAAYSMQ